MVARNGDAPRQTGRKLLSVNRYKGRINLPFAWWAQPRWGGSESLLALLRLRPHPSLPTLIDLDVNHVRPTADGTVLDIFLRSARRCIDWYHNFFAAAVAHIARIAAHGNDSSRTMTDA